MVGKGIKTEAQVEIILEARSSYDIVATPGAGLRIIGEFGKVSIDANAGTGHRQFTVKVYWSGAAESEPMEIICRNARKSNKEPPFGGRVSVEISSA